MSTASRRKKEQGYSIKEARKSNKAMDRLAKETNKGMRKAGAKLKFSTPSKGGRRRYIGYK
jgi:hypothetical protein